MDKEEAMRFVEERLRHQASPFVGLVATTVPDGAEVLTVPREFTSVTFPFLAQAALSLAVDGLANWPSAPVQ